MSIHMTRHDIKTRQSAPASRSVRRCAGRRGRRDRQLVSLRRGGKHAKTSTEEGANSPLRSLLPCASAAPLGAVTTTPLPYATPCTACHRTGDDGPSCRVGRIGDPSLRGATQAGAGGLTVDLCAASPASSLNRWLTLRRARLPWRFCSSRRCLGASSPQGCNR